MAEDEPRPFPEPLWTENAFEVLPGAPSFLPCEQSEPHRYRYEPNIRWP